LLFLLLIRAFDFILLNGTASGIGAGTAVADWRHALNFNPAQARFRGKIAGSVVYTTPYGLEGINCLRTETNFQFSRLGFGVGLQSLGLAGYGEYDIGSAFSFEIVDDFCGGVGAHALVRNLKEYGLELIPAFDFGMVWQISRLQLGVAVQQLNKPKYKNGDELLPSFRAGIGWEPVKAALLAVDIEKKGEDERLVSGVELRIFPEVKVRAGLETALWCLRAGIGLNWNWLGVDYGYQYHPELGDTHIIGLSCRWN